MFVEKFLADGRDPGGALAQTGSMVHLGIQVYHTREENHVAAITAMKASAEDLWPDADLDMALMLLAKYIDREKHERRGLVRQVEEAIKITIPCASFDPTGEEICINGTLDQIRVLVNKKKIMVVDHKTGQKGGAKMVRQHSPQLAAYMLGAAKLYPGHDVEGYITRIQDLRRSDLPYWWKMPFGLKDCMRILDPVRTRIAAIRAMAIDHTPGDFCDYCMLQNYPGCNTVKPGKAIPLPLLNKGDTVGAKGTKGNPIVLKPKPLPGSINDLWSLT